MYAIQTTPEASNGIDAAAYFEDCYNAMLGAGLGTNQFVITISPSAWNEVESAYQNGTIRDGYLARVLNALGGSSCNLDIQVQEQQNGDFVITFSRVQNRRQEITNTRTFTATRDKSQLSVHCNT